jgi:hypothetical protein
MTEAIQESAFFRVRHTCFIQTVCGLMESGDNIVDRFIELAEEQPEVATRSRKTDLAVVGVRPGESSCGAQLERETETTSRGQLISLNAETKQPAVGHKGSVHNAKPSQEVATTGYRPDGLVTRFLVLQMTTLLIL